MGQQVQDSQIENYRRRMQREAPATRVRTLFDQSDVLRQTYTVTIGDGVTLNPRDRLSALVSPGPGGIQFSVVDGDGRVVGTIRGESGRVLAQEMAKSELSAVAVTVTATIPVTGDARVQIVPE